MPWLALPCHSFTFNTTFSQMKWKKKKKTNREFATASIRSHHFVVGWCCRFLSICFFLFQIFSYSPSHFRNGISSDDIFIFKNWIVCMLLLIILHGLPFADDLCESLKINRIHGIQAQTRRNFGIGKKRPKILSIAFSCWTNIHWNNKHCDLFLTAAQAKRTKKKHIFSTI